MAEREELLESALNALAEGAALADSHGTVVSWNDAAAAITGYRAIEVIGRSVPHVLELIVVGGSNHWVRATEPETHTEHG